MYTVEDAPTWAKDINDTPWHERYGVSKISVGQGVRIDIDDADRSTAANRVHAYGAYHNKKFRTRSSGSVLYVLRIA